MTTTDEPRFVGVLNNKYPCCGRKTQFHNLAAVEDGSTREVTCSKDGTQWSILFELRKIKPTMPPVLKLTWTKTGGLRDADS